MQEIYTGDVQHTPPHVGMNDRTIVVIVVILPCIRLWCPLTVSITGVINSSQHIQNKQNKKETRKKKKTERIDIVR
jgi:hypothetical protein